MALTASQKSRLPNSAFAYPAKRLYPVPTKAQAKKAGISEAQRLRTHRSALAYSARASTAGSYTKVRSVVQKRSSVAAPAPRRRTPSRPASRMISRRR